jgi:hypothetical protein
MANGWWRNAAADNNLNNAANWYDAESGGSLLGRVPTTGDNAYFSATASSANATASAVFACDAIDCTAAGHGGTGDYGGTIDFATFGLTLTEISQFEDVDFGSGTHTVAFIYFKGTVDFASCTITFSSVCSLNGATSVTKGTSTLKFAGTTDLIAGSGSGKDDFYKIEVVSGTLTHYDSYDWTISNNLKVDGTLSIPNGRKETLTGTATVTGSGTISNASTGKIVYASTATYDFAGTQSAIVEFKESCTINAHTYGDEVRVYNDAGTGTVTITPGAGTHTFNGDISNEGMVAGGTCIFALNTNNPTFDVNGSVTFSATDGTFTVNFGTSTIDCCCNVNIQAITTITGTPTWNLTGAGAGTQTIEFFYMNVGNIVVNDAGATKRFSSDGFICTNFTLTAGTVDNSANNPPMTIKGDVVIDAGATYTYGSGTITIAGTVAQDIDFGAKRVENLVVTNNSAIVTFSNDFDTYNFLCTVIGAQLVFYASGLFNIIAGGLFTVTGNSSTDTVINSGTVTSPAYIDLPLKTNIAYCDIRDIHNTSITTQDVSFCDDLTGNSGLIFVEAYIWNGGGGDELATTGANWIGGSVPAAGYPLYFGSTSPKNCTYDLSANYTNMDLDMEYTGTVTLGANLNISANLTVNNGVLDFGSSNSIEIGGTLTLASGGGFVLNDANVYCLGDVSLDGGASLSPGSSIIHINGTVVQDVSINNLPIYDINCSNTTSLITFSTGVIGNSFVIQPSVYIQFQDNETFVFDSLDWQGKGTDHIYLESVSGGAWYLDVSGTAIVNYVEVSDSDASGGIEIETTNSLDNGDNINWVFGPTGLLKVGNHLLLMGVG